MSKENLSNKSSINPPEEAIKNAQESNAKQPDISQKSETPKTSEKSKQESQDTRRVLKDDKGLKASRVARVFATVGMVIASAFSSPIKAVENIPKLAAPLDNLSAGGVIKEKGVAPPNLIDKGLDKLLKPIPGGATVSKAIQKTYKTIGTRPVALGIKLTGIAVSLAFPVVSIPVALAIAGVSIAATAYNVGKETLEVRDEKLRNAEKKSLENIKEAKQTQRKLLESKAQEITGKSSPDLENFLAHKGGEMYRKPSEEVPEKPFTNTYFKEFMKVCRDSVPGFVSTLAGAAAVANPVGWIAAGTTMAANFLGETDNKLVRMEQKKDTTNQINELKAFASDYTDPKKLPELERQEKISTAVLKEFLETTPNIEKLNQVQLEAAYATHQKKIEESKEFELPLEKTKTQKFVSGVKEWAGYVADSQFSDLKALHSKKDEKAQDTNASKKQGPSPVQSKVQEQVQDMQENLTHGKISSYSSKISAPSPRKSASKKQESSRGV